MVLRVWYYKDSKESLSGREVFYFENFSTLLDTPEHVFDMMGRAIDHFNVFLNNVMVRVETDRFGELTQYDFWSMYCDFDEDGNTIWKDEEDVIPL